ncbi:MAG: hypothetical protein ACREMC_04920, partial [Gemmatimonadales bacterium]
YLLNVHRRLQRSPGEDLLGHRPPCDEIADLLGRFPRQRGWTASLECARARARVRARPLDQEPMLPTRVLWGRARGEPWG